ncbi:MAG: hypothetical protein JKY02_10975 [Flavobacteriaceae bacterium]|nr:hypothetical protein [Flavobacteriaceae bacterium]
MQSNFLSKITRSNIFILCVGVLFFYACQPEPKGDATRIKKGVFEIAAGKGYSKTTITRVDSLQIEEYTKYIEISSDSGSYRKEEKRIDTLYIKWKNNFFYTLRMKSPKNDLDNDPIFVQITKVTNNSYDFSAKIGFSKFKQNGTVLKVK